MRATLAFNGLISDLIGVDLIRVNSLKTFFYYNSKSKEITK